MQQKADRPAARNKLAGAPEQQRIKWDQGRSPRANYTQGSAVN